MAASAQIATTVIHEILAGFTTCMFAEMADATLQRRSAAASPPPSEADATAAIARFAALSGEVRGAAILGPDGEVLAASGDRAHWGAAAGALLRAADAAAGARAAQAHVATEEGEVYAIRFGGLAMIAVCDRFALASLIMSDMRAALRGLGVAVASDGAC